MSNITIFLSVNVVVNKTMVYVNVNAKCGIIYSNFSLPNSHWSTNTPNGETYNTIEFMIIENC